MSSGISVPDAAMPKPSPRKIMPLANPRRAGGMCGRIVVATSTMIAPPESPDKNRHMKNHAIDKG
jgi:hypothetical protein